MPPPNLLVPEETARSSARPLPDPERLRRLLPLTGDGQLLITRARHAVRAVLDGDDPRLLVLAGPCSVHDPAAAAEYAYGLRDLAVKYSGQLLVIMRVYLEKPRTALGWAGMLHDPRMTGGTAGDDVSRGLFESRNLLRQLASMGMPAGYEFVSTVAAGYMADLVTLGAIGARTSASQGHRQLAAGLPMPVGFKNGTDGNIEVAVNGCLSASARHAYLGSGDTGPAAVTANGNPDTFVILRGGDDGPNYSAGQVAGALGMIRSAGLPPRLMIDCSHGNSRKDFRRQPEVAAAVAAQVAAGNTAINGVMLESFLVEGRQEPGDLATLTYGQSVTDACMNLEATDRTLAVLAAAAAARMGRL